VDRLKSPDYQKLTSPVVWRNNERMDLVIYYKG